MIVCPDCQTLPEPALTFLPLMAPRTMLTALNRDVSMRANAHLALLQGFYEAILVFTAQLSKHNNHLDGGDILVPQAVIAQGGARIHIAPNRYACNITVSIITAVKVIQNFLVS